MRRLDPRGLDAVAGVALAGLGVAQVSGSDALHGPLALALVLAAVPGGAIALRRRHPFGVLPVFFAAMLVLQVAVMPLDDVIAPFLALLCLPYAAGAFLDGRRAVAALAVALAGFVVVTTQMAHAGSGDYLFGGSIVAGSWFAGRTVRVRVQLAAELHEAAQRAEESRDEEALRAVGEERRRIAREMHDVVAHSVSVMVVQAGGARRILASDPDRAVEAAQRIEETGRAAMAEMRRLLGVLHPDDAAARAPQPTLAGVAALVARARDAGLPVSLTVEGEERPLASGVDLAAYRVVQEALTNALKYAGRAETDVRVRWGQEALELEIVDRGPGPAAARRAAQDGAPAVAGHGLIGMRERVRLYGGELTTGRGRGGGFAVRARLPLTTEETLA